MIGPLPIIVFVLCFLTAAACTWLLLRGYRRSGARLLLWSGLCFAFLSINSLAVVLDVVAFPTYSMLPLRQFASLAAVATLLIGLVWEAE